MLLTDRIPFTTRDKSKPRVKIPSQLFACEAKYGSSGTISFRVLVVYSASGLQNKAKEEQAEAVFSRGGNNVL